MNKPLLPGFFLIFTLGCTVQTEPQCCQDDRCPIPSVRHVSHPKPVPPYTPDHSPVPGPIKLPSFLKFADETPDCDLPMEMREKNYSGGSCYVASTIMVLRQQGLEDMADWFRETYRGGQSTGGMVRKLEKAGCRFAYTDSGDPAFLDWCSRTRRWAAITYKPSHAINFCGWTKDGQQAILLDNNRVRSYEYVEREKFLSNWKRRYGGGAITVVYTPSPPRPWL